MIAIASSPNEAGPGDWLLKKQSQFRHLRMLPGVDGEFSK